MAIQIRTSTNPQRSANSATQRPPRFSVLDVVDEDMFRGTTSEFVDTVIAWTRRPRFRIAVGVSAHTINLAAGDRMFAKHLQATEQVYCDGQSVVWAARVLGVRVAERSATTDVAPLLIERAAREGLRLYFLGGSDGVAEAAAARMRIAHPGVQIRTHHGYIDREQSDAVVADIAAWRTDVLLIGLGDPLQLSWLNQHREQLGRITALTSGGLFDWMSERHRRAPRWMIHLGLEWLHRLAIEPGRLWRRYIIGNPAFVMRVVLAALHRRGRSRAAAAGAATVAGPSASSRSGIAD